MNALTTATPPATGTNPSEATSGTNTRQSIASARARYSLMRQALDAAKPKAPAADVARVLNFLRTA